MSESGCSRDVACQNLEVAGTISGARRPVIALTNVATIAKSLLASDSGALVTVDPSTNSATTVTVTLPSPEVGLEYTFAITADAGNANADVIIQTSDNAVDFRGMLTQGNAANATSASQTVLELSNSTITFDASVSTTFGNTVFTCVCDGSHWVTTGNSTAVSGTTNPVLSN